MQRFEATYFKVAMLERIVYTCSEIGMSRRYCFQIFHSFISVNCSIFLSDKKKGIKMKQFIEQGSNYDESFVKFNFNVNINFRALQCYQNYFQKST